jgi:hypothetical protein
LGDVRQACEIHHRRRSRDCVRSAVSLFDSLAVIEGDLQAVEVRLDLRDIGTYLVQERVDDRRFVETL